MQDKLDLYTDYLLTTVHQATATGLSRLVDGAISHDGISRLLSENEFTSKAFKQYFFNNLPFLAILTP